MRLLSFKHAVFHITVTINKLSVTQARHRTHTNASLKLISSEDDQQLLAPL